MTKEEQKKYKELTRYLLFSGINKIAFVVQLRCLRPEFSKKVEQLFLEEQKYLKLQIEEL